MGFAAHLRFHFMETVVCTSILYVPLAMIGFGLDYGSLRYVLNNPAMHIWHHAVNSPCLMASTSESH